MDNYTFMRMGNLYQATMDVMIAACKRFGAENPDLAIRTITDAINNGLSYDDLCKYVITETGAMTDPTWDDVDFVKMIIRAEKSIKRTIEDLNKAIDKREENKDVKK